jgi:hypothetical protein
MSASCLFLCPSCHTRPQTVENVAIDIDQTELSNDVNSLYLNMGHKVLYALPTPIEATMLVKNWGIPHPELLNEPANASKYLTTKKKAVNFGVYMTDLTCSGLYGQTQTVLQYKQAMQQLVEGLGLQSAVDPKVIQRIEDNINNKNELMQIFSDIYASSTTFLSEDNRDFYALAILTGGWVEGMYIATSMIDETESANEIMMKQVIDDNKLTFDLLWQALGALDHIPDDAVYLMLNMSYVAHLFGHQTLLSVPQSTSIQNTQAFFTELKNQIQDLRHQFTKLTGQ